MRPLLQRQSERSTDQARAHNRDLLDLHRVQATYQNWPEKSFLSAFVVRGATLCRLKMI
jgi:hypothetical protein